MNEKTYEVHIETVRHFTEQELHQWAAQVTASEHTPFDVPLHKLLKVIVDGERVCISSNQFGNSYLSAREEGGD